ncbi:MAG: hypothetical protein D6775_00940 [Caldilineae bacterium]|nr:MAG: hypothetical protein D6775_00940 [Caldilineae bacterium]
MGAGDILDVYLWAPGAGENVKLRFGHLKFKRLLQRDGELECWLEEESEVYPFPLQPRVVARLAAALGVRFPSLPEVPLDHQGFTALLKETDPAVSRVLVHKRRTLHGLPLSSGEVVLVELTEILRPEAVITVALEHEQAQAVQAALDILHPVEAGLEAMSYLQALAEWAQGRTLS